MTQASIKEKTIKTIEQINKEVGHIASVQYLPRYPHEDEHLQVNLHDIPFKIERGHDQFFYNNYKTGSKPHLWYVSRSDRDNPELYIQKGFASLKGAIEATFKAYEKELLKLKSDLNTVQGLFRKEAKTSDSEVIKCSIDGKTYTRWPNGQSCITSKSKNT